MATDRVPILGTRHGRVYRWWVRWFGERDPVDEQLREIARQGRLMARMAHSAAFLLLVLFSLGSLVALGSDALDAVLRQWQASHTLDVPDAINVAVTTFLVFCFDIGMLYAASRIRLLRVRRAPLGDMGLHIGVLVLVALLESSTYAYMGWKYDAPTLLVAWLLILARAAAAPGLAVYLSLAQPLPVTPRDIMAQVEITSGRGVLKDTVTLANDPTASLAEKAEVFDAAAEMTSHDRGRLQKLIGVVGKRTPQEVRVVEADAPATLPPPSGPGGPDGNGHGPRGGGIGLPGHPTRGLERVERAWEPTRREAEEWDEYQEDEDEEVAVGNERSNGHRAEAIVDRSREMYALSGVLPTSHSARSGARAPRTTTLERGASPGGKQRGKKAKWSRLERSGQDPVADDPSASNPAMIRGISVLAEPRAARSDRGMNARQLAARKTERLRVLRAFVELRDTQGRPVSVREAQRYLADKTRSKINLDTAHYLLETVRRQMRGVYEPGTEPEIADETVADLEESPRYPQYEGATDALPLSALRSAVDRAHQVQQEMGDNADDENLDDTEPSMRAITG